MIEIRKVPADGNCIFWATMMAYLEPVKKNKIKFQKRYQNLFKQLKAWQNLYDNFNNENDYIKNFKDIMLLFRENIINYMQENINKEQKELLITLLPNFNVKNRNILDIYGIKYIENFEQYCDIMKKDGVYAEEIELIYISKFLKHNLVIFTDENRNQKININEKFKEEIKLNYVNGNHYNYFIETLEYDSGYNSKLDNDDSPEKVFDDILNNHNPTNNLNSLQEILNSNDMLTNKDEIKEKKDLKNLQKEIEISKKTLQQLNSQVRLLEQKNLKLLQKNQSSKNNKKFQELYNKLKIINLTNMKKIKELKIMINNHNEIIEKLEQEIKNKNFMIEVKEKSVREWKSKYEEVTQKKNFGIEDDLTFGVPDKANDALEYFKNKNILEINVDGYDTNSNSKSETDDEEIFYDALDNFDFLTNYNQIEIDEIQKLETPIIPNNKFNKYPKFTENDNILEINVDGYDTNSNSKSETDDEEIFYDALDNFDFLTNYNQIEIDEIQKIETPIIPNNKFNKYPKFTENDNILKLLDDLTFGVPDKANDALEYFKNKNILETDDEFIIVNSNDLKWLEPSTSKGQSSSSKSQKM